MMRSKTLRASASAFFLVGPSFERHRKILHHKTLSRHTSYLRQIPFRIKNNDIVCCIFWLLDSQKKQRKTKKELIG